MMASVRRAGIRGGVDQRDDRVADVLSLVRRPRRESGPTAELSASDQLSASGSIRSHSPTCTLGNVLLVAS